MSFLRVGIKHGKNEQMEKLKVLDLFSGKTIWHDKKGYACVWVEGKTKKCHVLMWEYYNGKKPEGHDIHHINEDKSDFSIDNLQLLRTEDHHKLHAGWKRTNGVWTHKPCNMCEKILSLDNFYPRKGYNPTALCKSCHCIKTKEWSDNNSEKRKEIGRNYYHRSKRAKA